MGFKSILLTTAVLALSTNVSAVTLTFDDIAGGSIQNTFGDVTSYQGFNFTSTLDWIDVEGSPSWNFGAVSGDFALLNNNGGTGIITAADSSDFTFDGVWAKSWATPANSGGGDTVFGTLAGYNNGNLVWSVSTGLNGSYEFYAAQTGLIDELHLGFGNHFLVDDLSLNEASVVPIPAAVWLFGSGLIGLVGVARRKKA